MLESIKKKKNAVDFLLNLKLEHIELKQKSVAFKLQIKKELYAIHSSRIEYIVLVNKLAPLSLLLSKMFKILTANILR